MSQKEKIVIGILVIAGLLIGGYAIYRFDEHAGEEARNDPGIRAELDTGQGIRDTRPEEAAYISDDKAGVIYKVMRTGEL